MEVAAETVSTSSQSSGLLDMLRREFSESIQAEQNTCEGISTLWVAVSYTHLTLPTILLV